MDRISRWPASASIALGFFLVTSWQVSLARAQGSIVNPDPAVRSDFSEPVMLTSKDGVLEVALTAHQGTRGWTRSRRQCRTSSFSHIESFAARRPMGKCRATICTRHRRFKLIRVRRSSST